MANMRQMQAEDAAKLQNGTHDSPFAVLGSHREAVRIFWPGARSVQIIHNGVVTDLASDDADLWVGPPVLHDYKIQVCAADGSLIGMNTSKPSSPVYPVLATIQPSIPPTVPVAK